MLNEIKTPEFMMSSNTIYVKVYINAMYLVVMYAFPFTVLAVLNSLIGMEIRRANINRSEMAKRSEGLSEEFKLNSSMIPGRSMNIFKLRFTRHAKSNFCFQVHKLTISC